jgi:hypothetical protein
VFARLSHTGITQDLVFPSASHTAPKWWLGIKRLVKGPVGAEAIRIKAPVGDLAAVLQALRSAPPGLSGVAGENAQALEAELQEMLKEVQRLDPDKGTLKQSVEQSHGLLKRLTEVGETTGKLKPILDLAGVAIGAFAKWLGM